MKFPFDGEASGALVTERHHCGTPVTRDATVTRSQRAEPKPR